MFQRFFSILCIYTAFLYSSPTCTTIIDETTLQGTCKGILKHGKFIGYHKNGMLAWEVHFKNNILHGKFTHFYPNGNIYFTGFYKNGMLDGSFKQYNQYDEALHANFKKGVLHNWLYTLYDDKKLEALRYYYGKLILQKYLDQ
ncbi:hypothetical protein CQA53_05390 [Helicobacter didelphidarum]|uniref:Toxin-antitoxin system YwqK family antitoxin n=1 Tax=Helicobacter didelphidarum TaxID=2040648 RepID=A0A3D8IML6_9HELI|nr:hypothetical protein [Helicobacter didelphidarum]RDU65884.1 hypothetical protein CQA53_05390 [Helicobacter didelphidarum]